MIAVDGLSAIQRSDRVAIRDYATPGF
jgi:hypothetical protein